MTPDDYFDDEPELPWVVFGLLGFATLLLYLKHAHPFIP